MTAAAQDESQPRVDAPTTGDDGWHAVGAVDEFEDRALGVVVVGERTVAIARRGERFMAFRDRCPHQGAPLCRGKLVGTLVPSRPGELTYGHDATVIRCPWHKWEWHLESGRAVGRTTNRRVATYEVKTVDGVVWLRLGHRRSRAITSDDAFRTGAKDV